jgi:hypothetical protein
MVGLVLVALLCLSFSEATASSDIGDYNRNIVLKASSPSFFSATYELLSLKQGYRLLLNVPYAQFQNESVAQANFIFDARNVLADVFHVDPSPINTPQSNIFIRQMFPAPCVAGMPPLPMPFAGGDCTVLDFDGTSWANFTYNKTSGATAFVSNINPNVWWKTSCSDSIFPMPPCLSSSFFR